VIKLIQQNSDVIAWFSGRQVLGKKHQIAVNSEWLKTASVNASYFPKLTQACNEFQP
jgi:hypothetical protein